MNHNPLIPRYALLGVVLLSACQQQVEPPAETQAAAEAQPKVVDLMAAPAPAPAAVANGVVSGAVAETIEAAGYTYVRIEVNGEALWAAGPPTRVAVGDGITFSTLIPMQNFHSKALNRDFPVLYFVDGFTVRAAGDGAAAPAQTAVTTAAATEAAAPVVLPKVEGGYTIAEALAQRAELAGKPIKVRGQVTKFTPGIMGKNWIHMVDGSGAEDLIVTTTATTAIGAVVVAEGALALDRDFGYGYRYEVLMEDAAVSAE